MSYHRSTAQQVRTASLSLQRFLFLRLFKAKDRYQGPFVDITPREITTCRQSCSLCRPFFFFVVVFIFFEAKDWQFGFLVYITP